MSRHALPREVTPLKYADQGRSLSGVVALSSLPRLATVLEGEPVGAVEVELLFTRDEQRQRLLKGSLHAHVNVVCQRCLEPVEIPVHSEFALGIVLNDEQARNLPRIYEPLMTEPERMDLFEVVEEELLLSLPMFAYHEHCRIGGSAEMERSEPAEPAVEKPNPFSVLSVLKKQ
jgi:uncharacterized protein